MPGSRLWEKKIDYFFVDPEAISSAHYWWSTEESSHDDLRINNIGAGLGVKGNQSLWNDLYASRCLFARLVFWKISESCLGNAIFLVVSLTAQTRFWLSQLNSFSTCLDSRWLSAQRTDAHPLLIVDYCSHHLIIGVEGKRPSGKQANIVITAEHRQIVNVSLSRETVAPDLFSSVYGGSSVM
jgi:hypothetical protein